MRDGMKQVTAWLPAEFVDQVKDKLAESGKNMRDVISEAFVKTLAENDVQEAIRRIEKRLDALEKRVSNK